MDHGLGLARECVSFTPGAVGITQATNALALDTCCGVATDTAVAYSSAQQLIVTAWNVVLALVLVVTSSAGPGQGARRWAYGDAKVKVADQKEQRAAKRQAKKQAKRDAKEAE